MAVTDKSAAMMPSHVRFFPGDMVFLRGGMTKRVGSNEEGWWDSTIGVGVVVQNNVRLVEDCDNICEVVMVFFGEKGLLYVSDADLCEANDLKDPSRLFGFRLRDW